MNFKFEEMPKNSNKIKIRNFYCGCNIPDSNIVLNGEWGSFPTYNKFSACIVVKNLLNRSNTGKF